MSDLDELPPVPGDAPPAILFRLSFRAIDDHRSGYRPGDDPERIVASMRGWWELDPDEAGSPYEDDRWRGRDDVRWCFNAKPKKWLADYVREAWVGAAGKRVPTSLRDTIVAYWPTSPIDNPRDLVGKALELLGRGMLPRMHGVFELRYGDDWHYKLRKQHRILPSVKHVPQHDPSVYVQALLLDAEAATFEKVSR